MKNYKKNKKCTFDYTMQILKDWEREGINHI